MGWKIWIDDDSFDIDQPQRNAPNGFFVALSVEEAIKITELMGCAPEFMELDHDLGEGPTVMGYLRYLNDKYFNNPPDYNIHSENPVGRENIKAFMETWKRCIKL